MGTFIPRTLVRAFQFSLMAFLITASSSLFAHGGGRGGGGGDSMRQRWICRADAVDGSGIFFLGIGRNYGEAYAMAQNTCARARRVCVVSCDPQFPSN